MMKTLILLFLLVATISTPAAADQTWDFIQLSCDPNFHFLSIRGIVLWGRPHGDTAPYTEMYERLRSKSSMYAPEQLAKTPFNCSFGDNNVSVAVENYLPARATGECGLVPHFEVAVRSDDKEIYRYRANRCMDQVLHIVDIDDNHIQDCEVAVQASLTGTQTSCKEGLRKRSKMAH
jgi:hypothetical protein